MSNLDDDTPKQHAGHIPPTAPPTAPPVADVEKNNSSPGSTTPTRPTDPPAIVYTGGKAFRQTYELWIRKLRFQQRTSALLDFIGDQVNLHSFFYFSSKIALGV
jgi:hypothetical protein